MSVALDKAKEVRKGENLDEETLSEFLGKVLSEPNGKLSVKQFPSGF